MASGLISRRPGALPVEVTSFVGRRGELTQLACQLRTTRLATVTGPGGVGKTRVALRTAAGCAGQFADGVCLAELAGLRDPELLPLTVASCLGLPDQETRSQLDAILDYLRKRQLLLMLDGCEQLVDACAALVTMLLRETAGVTVLATSRQPLDAVGEHICQIPPLPVPELGSQDAGHEDAVELFAQRAAAVVSGFGITDDNRDDVIRLCRRLDGIPLAIELATVRLRAVPLKQLAGRIDDRFRLLTGERRAALPHHRTLRTATQWSYELCSPAEQLLWTRLSVFAGSFDASAAEQVCAGEPLATRDILPTLIGLPVNDLGGLVGLDIFTGYLYLLAGEPDRAIERCTRGLGRLPAGSRERWMQSWLNFFIGLSSLMLGAFEQSAASVSRALEMKQELGDNVGTAWCLEVLAWVAAGQQRPRRAAGQDLQWNRNVR
jgi:hypothetical protein